MNEQTGTVNVTRPIVKGSIVRYKDGWVKVTRLTSKTVNLGAIFGGKIYHKGIPLSEVYEDEAEWYNHWTQSETYKCM
jgi:hypothetical protein